MFPCFRQAQVRISLWLWVEMGCGLRERPEKQGSSFADEAETNMNATEADRRGPEHGLTRNALPSAGHASIRALTQG